MLKTAAESSAGKQGTAEHNATTIPTKTRKLKASIFYSNEPICYRMEQQRCSRFQLLNGKVEYNSTAVLTSFEESEVPLLVSPLQLRPPLVKAPDHALFLLNHAVHTHGRSGNTPEEAKDGNTGPKNI